MYAITKQSGKDSAYLTEITVDNETEIEDVSTTDFAIGSTILVISTADVYMLNSKREWELLGG